MTDPIADLLTRIRNALHARHDTVQVPASTIKVAVVDILKKRGFIKAWRMLEKPVQSDIEISLRYMMSEAPAIQEIKRISSPGCRIYHKATQIRPILGGRGIAIYSTPKGVLSGEEARKAHVGGEFLCRVW